MKQYFIQLTALTLLSFVVGCQKDEHGLNVKSNPTNSELNISIDGLPLDATTSRAVIPDMPDFTKNAFTIAGYYTKESAGKSGLFGDNIDTAHPNVFNYISESVQDENSVIKPTVKDGKYQVKLSQWQLSAESCLSYFAWASNVETGVIEGASTNPILSATTHFSPVGAPFISVTSGSATNSINVDVVAAKSLNNNNDIVRSSIDLNFKHILSKLKFNIQNIAPVDIALIEVKIKFGAEKVSRNARYLFNGDDMQLGTWGSYTPKQSEANYAVTLADKDLKSKAEAVHLDEILIIPQTLENGAISLEFKYTIPNATSRTEYTRTIPLDARTFEQNTSYTYDITLSETQILINKGRIADWIDSPTVGDLPYVVGARDENVLLLLDAYDAPYTSADGNKYWLDRSGWNRHCKLVGAGTTYDPAKKCYSLSGSASYYIEAPAFPSTEATTVDIIARSTRTNNQLAEQRLLNFITSTDQRVMLSHFNYNGGTGLFFDAGQTSHGDNRFTRVNGDVPLELYKVFALYSFSKNISGQAVYRNLIYQLTEINTGQGGNSNIDLSTATTRQFGNSFSGEIKYIKVSKFAKPKITKTEYAELAKRHKLQESDYVVDYIKDGLLLDLQGINSPDGGLWKDMSGNGAHAKLVGNVIYDPINKEYKTGADVNSYLEIQLPESWKADGFFNDHTLEIVYYVPKKDGVLATERHNHFVGLDNAGNRTIFFHVGFAENFAINYHSPLIWADGYPKVQLNVDIKDGGAMIGAKKSYYAARSMSTSGANEVYMEVRVSNGWTKALTTPGHVQIGAVTNLKIGQDLTNISAIRLYRRQLYYKDNAKNVNADRRTYGTPPAVNPEV